MPNFPAHATGAESALQSGRALRLAPLAILLGGILFPFEWLGQLYPAFGRALNRVFANDLAHAAGHLTLFALLGLTALGLFPALLARPRRYFGLLALIGVGQEALQLLFKRRGLVFDDGRDLVVDLLGLTLALIVAWRWRRGAAREERLG